MAHWLEIIEVGVIDYQLVYFECIQGRPSDSYECQPPYSANRISFASSNTYMFYLDVPPVMGNTTHIEDLIKRSKEYFLNCPIDDCIAN